jgi:hypothetical protein
VIMSSGGLDRNVLYTDLLIGRRWLWKDSC